jgi:hypothetical protein
MQIKISDHLSITHLITQDALNIILSYEHVSVLISILLICLRLLKCIYCSLHYCDNISMRPMRYNVIFS